MCNAYNHHPGCDCGWGGGNGWGHVSVPPIETWAPAAPNRERSGPRLDDYAPEPHERRPTLCPRCGAWVYFVRPENGGAIWLDEMGPPWPLHACFDTAGAGQRWAPAKGDPGCTGLLDRADRRERQVYAEHDSGLHGASRSDGTCSACETLLSAPAQLRAQAHDSTRLIVLISGIALVVLIAFLRPVTRLFVDLGQRAAQPVLKRAFEGSVEDLVSLGAGVQLVAVTLSGQLPLRSLAGLQNALPQVRVVGVRPQGDADLFVTGHPTDVDLNEGDQLVLAAERDVLAKLLPAISRQRPSENEPPLS